MTKTHFSGHWMLLAAGLVLGGCYSGLDGQDGSASASAGQDGGDGADGADGADAEGGDADDDDDDTPDPPEGERTEEGRWRRLTTVQYHNAVEDLLGVDVDTSGFLDDTTRGDSPFPANAGIAPQAIDIDIYWQTAGDVAIEATADLPALLGGCDIGADATGCATAFIDDFATRAFRRPLEDGQRDALLGLFELGAEESATVGLQMIISAVLQSPQFLYITEYGEEIDPGLFALDGYEIASRLSFLLTNSVPDETLLGMAPELTDRDVLVAQAERLIDTPAFLDTLVEAQLHMTHISRLDEVSRSEQEFDAELRESMRNEAAQFIRAVMEEDGTVEGLLTSPIAFPDARLAADVYGFGGDGSRVDVDDGTRVGLLTLPAFLASSPPVESDFEIVYRGNAIRTRMLCDILPPPGADVMFGEPDPDATPREILEQHQEDPACGGCHVLMDNIGFGFLNYDDLGRWHETDTEGPIDASGYVVSGEEHYFDDAAGLSEVLAGLPQLRNCMTKQMFRLALAREPDAADAESMAAVSDIMDAGGGDLRGALIALVSSDAFVLRRGE